MTVGGKWIPAFAGMTRNGGINMAPTIMEGPETEGLTLEIDDGTGGLKKQINLFDRNKQVRHLQITGLPEGETITVFISADGEHWATASYDGENDFIIDSDCSLLLISGDIILKFVGTQELQGSTKIIAR
jgi:hypothetical protein